MRFFASLCCLGLSLAASAAVELPQFITSNMVVQRNATLTVNGRAKAGSEVRVRADWSAETLTARADGQGRFTVQIPTPEAGGPYNLTFDDGELLTLSNILSGEVWLCSGQSNMEMPIAGWGNIMDREHVLATGQKPDIRLLQLQKQTAFAPQEDTRVSMGGWVECSPATLPEFSAIGYLYASELLEELHIPIGVIDCTWGGTPAEAWTSYETLRGIKGFETEIGALERCHFNADELAADYRRQLDAWNQKLQQATADAETRALKTGTLSAPGNWERTVLPGFNGVAFLTRTIDIPAAWEGKPMTLHLGTIDDEDITYLNGTEVGRTGFYTVQRNYQVDGKLVKAGKAELKIRVTDFDGDGGFCGNAQDMYAEVGGERLSLAGDWQYRAAVDFASLPARPTAVGGSHYPSVLYNAMLRPLHVLPIRGVIWYQGCANVGRDEQYTPLFQGMIQNWRQLWGYDFPFYFVQLAGWLDAKACQPESEWAALRQSQANALQLPNTGMAVAIDLGNPADIHPKNKQEVARRLALHALSKTYGRKGIVADGPRLVKQVVKGNEIVLTFDKEVLAASSVMQGFIIGDGTRWTQAQARRLNARTIAISNPAIAQPTVCHYNWADYPNGNLYGKTGLPALPF